MDANFLLMEWQNGFEATLDARVVLTDTYIPMTPVPNGNFGRLVLEDTSRENFEIIRYNRKDAGGVYVETGLGGLRNEDGTSTGIHPRGARVRGNITAQDVRELRKAAKDVQDGYMAMTAGSDWKAIPIIPTLLSSAGQREHVLRYTGVNYSTTIGAGTKLRIPRTGTTPTTSMGFVAASSQYASKTSPAGITFTDDYTIETLVSPSTYTRGWMVSRMPAGASSGFGFRVMDSGGVQIWNSNGTTVQTNETYQALPLNKWSHIAATVDLSGNSVKLYIDGAEVPTFKTGSISAMVQAAADLRIGVFTSSTEYFNGQLANVRIWSTVRTAAEIRDNMNKEIPASTTGLVAHYKGNGSWNDSSTNANHLTAAGGAVNNFASHPYSATEYAIVTKVAYAGGNTDVTVFTGSNCVPNETLGATSYSNARSPYGFPASRKNWQVKLIHRVTQSQTSPAGGIWYNIGNTSLAVPTGEWKGNYKAALFVTKSPASIQMYSTFSSANNTDTDKETTCEFYNVAATDATTPVSSPIELSLGSMTTHYVNGATNIPGVSRIEFANSGSPLIVTLECAYL